MNKKWHSLLLGIFLSPFLCICFYCAFCFAASKQILKLPKPSGTYKVGRVIYSWTDTSRKETLSDKSSYRELVVGIWYPTLKDSQEKSVYYPRRWQSVLEKEQGPFSFFTTHPYEKIQPWSSENAPIASSSNPFPVVIFQPGFGKSAFDYTTLLEDIASHGYIVVASTPTYSADLVVFNDGRRAPATSLGSLPDNAGIFSDEMNKKTDELLGIWEQDVSFLLSRVGQISNDKDSFIYGKTDMSKIAVMGHSFGGAVAYQFCKSDLRCKISIDIDGTLFGSNKKKARVPLIYLSADHSKDTGDSKIGDDYTESVLKDQIVGTSSLSIKDSAHMNFSDLGITSPRLRYFGVLGPIDGVTCLQQARKYLQISLDKNLKAESLTSSRLQRKDRL